MIEPPILAELAFSTVYLTDAAAACKAAIAAVNDCSAWRALDDVGPTYVDAIADGDDVDP